MADPVRSLSVSLWVQPAGPNTAVEFLGCHAITTVTKPRGNNTLNHCPDPVNPGKYIVSSKTKAAPGLVTFSIETKIYKLFDFLENLKCPVPIIAQAVSCSPKNLFSNWDRAFVFLNSDNVQEGISNLLTMTDENEVMQSFDMEADDMLRLAPLRIGRDLDIAETQALNSIFACDVDSCAGSCGNAHEQCDTMYAVSDAVNASASGRANLWTLSNNNWSVAEADPFGTSENIIGGGCFALSRSTRRIVVFRGTTDAGNPAEAAYTDDGGVTWTTVSFGSDNGEFVSSPKAVAVLDANNIWVGTDSGRIYFSNDGGSSFTVQENQGIHSAKWNVIQMLDARNGFAGGDADVIAVTSDGGQVWSQVNATGSGDDIVAGAMIDINTIWVGTSGGELFYSNDGGVTWTERTGFAGSGIGMVDDILFLNNQVGYVSMRNGSNLSTILTTRTGGYNWEEVESTGGTNIGINKLLSCGLHKLYAVGEASGGKPVIYKAQPVG